MPTYAPPYRISAGGGIVEVTPATGAVLITPLAGQSTVVSAGGLQVTAGNFGVGIASATTDGIRANGAILSGAVTQYGARIDPTYGSDATTAGRGVYSIITTAAAAFTMATGAAFYADNPSEGAGSAITTAIGYYAAAITTSVTNAYGLYVETPTGGATNNYGAYFAGGAPAIYVNAGGARFVAGNVGVGAANAANVGLLIRTAILTTNTDQWGIVSDPTSSSAATTSIGGAYFSAITAAAAFTATSAYGIYVDSGTLGAGSTITTQYGALIKAQNKGGTNNYGIYVEAPSGGATANVGIYNVGTSRLVGNVDLGTAGTTLGAIKFNGNTSGTITVQSAAAAGTWTWTLPPDDGDAGEQLQTDGAGVTTWEAAASVRESKNILGQLAPRYGLQRILAAPVYEFQYRTRSTRGQRITTTGDYDTHYAGVMADEAPWAMHHSGRIFSPVSAFGHTALAIQDLHERLALVEQTLGFEAAIH